MNFTQAIASGFDNYVNFRGRAARSEFWYWTLFSDLALGVAWFTDHQLGTVLLSWLVNLALTLPGLAVSVRRLHDIGRSGWWYLIVLVPIAGVVMLLFFFVSESDPWPNRFG